MGRDTESGQSGSCCPESVSGADSVAGGAALLARLANAAVRLFPAPSISLKGLFGAELTEGVKQAEGHSCTDSAGGGGIRNGESPRRVPSGAASLEPFDTSHQHTHTHKTHKHTKRTHTKHTTHTQNTHTHTRTRARTQHSKMKIIFRIGWSLAPFEHINTHTQHTHTHTHTHEHRVVRRVQHHLSTATGSCLLLASCQARRSRSEDRYLVFICMFMFIYVCLYVCLLLEPPQ